MSTATVVRGLAAEVLQKEHEARENASRRYPKLIELKTADPKSVGELQDVMRVLGKSASDISVDLETLRRGRELLEVIRRGSGLDEQREAADKAVEEHMAETPRIVEERRRELWRLTTVQSDLGSLYGTAEGAVRELERLKASTGHLLQYVEVPKLT